MHLYCMKSYTHTHDTSVVFKNHYTLCFFDERIACTIMPFVGKKLKFCGKNVRHLSHT